MGTALVDALLGPQPGTWLAAFLQVFMAAVPQRGRARALAALARVPIDQLPLRVVNECFDQVSPHACLVARIHLCSAPAHACLYDLWFGKAWQNKAGRWGLAGSRPVT